MALGAAFLWIPDAEAGTSTLQGNYKFSGGMRELRAIADAIEAVVAEMSIVARPIARKRLTEAARPHNLVTIGVGEKNIVVKLSERLYAAPADGTRVTVTGDDGDPVELHYIVSERTIAQHFEVEDGGGKTNTFRKSGKKGMRVEVRIHSERLPRDLTYKLTYSAE